MADLGNDLKQNNLIEIECNGKKIMECTICKRHFTTKRSALYHQHSAHNMSPQKRIKKKYIDNPDAVVPRSTKHYKRKKESDSFVSEHGEKECQDGDELNMPSLSEIECEIITENQENYSDMHQVCENQTDVFQTEDNNNTKKYEDDDSQLCKNDDKSDEDYSSLDEDSFNSSSDEREISDSSDSNSSFSCEADELKDKVDYEDTEMMLLSCFLRNNFSASSSKDILLTMKKAFPDCRPLQEVQYDNLWKHLNADYAYEVHYCEKCFHIFPDNQEVTNCRQCDSPRYKHGMNGSQLPRASFVYANMKTQLKNLLQSPGIWNDIKGNKERIRERHLENPFILTDITDGQVYKALSSEGSFLDMNNNITALINTDGLSLYSSSKIQLWPVFIAINEMTPSLRFARENIILAGIWQGKGKPPMMQYLEPLCAIFNDLYENGIVLDLDDRETTVKLKVLCGTYDLPAKSSLLNMTQYNGSESCITCEEPGKVVKHGKGHCRSFPYRENPYPTRNQETVTMCMKNSTSVNRIKGFKGNSALLNLKDFDVVAGSPPDYMHGALLGVTKSLLHKWLSPTESKNPYFVGKKLKTISKRMTGIQPPQCMERLPRDLEKNYNHFKATELQAWLLYYGVPCLQGILPEIFLEHFALLSEGVYLLLKDQITGEDLERAETVLEMFFRQFCTLYPEGTCGLNVHNIGTHYTYYVRLMGPLWAWSCFPFEDCNSMITKAVHGTGNVTHQIMKIKEAQTLLRNSLHLNTSTKERRSWKLKSMSNCEIAGAIQEISDEHHKYIILNILDVRTQEISDIKKVDRIQLDGKKMYSNSYTRMKRRCCHVYITKYNRYVFVQYFVLHTQTKLVFAFVQPLHLQPWGLGSSHAGKHFQIATIEDTYDLVLADHLLDNVWFINVKDINIEKFVVKAPNTHGHAIFK
ncbi:uncharacterized protein LOC134280215 [Saccostrea cucullata]|uniref:uncharacterized protein LOC134280215 n=1 Tax=Saccostrea cuccullata TaxID=36930 RepID=UPI002ED2E241